MALAQAQVLSAKAQYEQTKAAMLQSHAQLAQSQHSVLTLDPLTAQREGKAAIIRNAEYNLNNCRVYAPFDARVTNLTISQGAYAHTGQQVFTLIDTRVWWAVANFRETQLRHIKPGMHADVYVLSRPNVRYDGVVDSVGFGVQPDATLVGIIRRAGTSRCAALPQLGTFGHTFSSAGAHSSARDGTVSAERIGGCGHATGALGKDAVVMSSQEQALPRDCAVART